METYRALRVVRADRGGSSWPVLIETDAGVFHTKLRGAGQAPASLVAEIIVGALADALGLSVPARVLIDIPSDVPVDDRHQELGDLLHRSVGRNLGFQCMSRVPWSTSLLSLIDKGLLSTDEWSLAGVPFERQEESGTQAFSEDAARGAPRSPRPWRTA